MFKLIPTWPILAAGIVFSFGLGAYADHKIMQGRIDKMVIAHTTELAAREAQRVKDEVAAREEERRLSARAAQIEQEKSDAINQIRGALDAANGRLQQRADRQPAGTSGVPAPRPACPGATGAELSRQDGLFLVGEAARANQLRAALSACYAAYDEVERKAPPPSP